MSESARGALSPELLARVRQCHVDGVVPIAILDIDLTLVDNAPRTREVFRRFALGRQGQWEGAERAARDAMEMPLVFSVRENLAALGITEPELAKAAFEAWLEGFFSDELCRLDVALDGAPEAVERLIAMGVTVVYLTARISRMREGTVARLSELGFPMTTVGTILIIKEDHSVDDVTFKQDALSWCGSLGRVVLAADNEPVHINNMATRFPEALALHVDTRHSPNAPEPIDGVRVVPSLLVGVSEHHEERP